MSVQSIMGATLILRSSEKLVLSLRMPIFSAFSVIGVLAGFLQSQWRFSLAAATKLLHKSHVATEGCLHGHNRTKTVSGWYGRVHGQHPAAQWLGARCDGSPIIVADGTRPPPECPSVYQPTACLGGRAPHAWLADGRSLYDALGFEFTLLLLGQLSADALANAANARGLPLTIVDVSAEQGLRDLYEADLALIRPDQIVCWRGNRLPTNAAALLEQVTGGK